MKRTLVLHASLFLVAMTTACLAQTPEDDDGLRANCVGDYFRFCATTMPGTSAIRQCFSRNIDKLTPECRGAIRVFDRRSPKRN